MGFFDTVKEGVQGHFDKKKQEREELERMQREVDFQRKQIFEEEFKKNALIVARGEAKKRAANLSGLQKLRAVNRARNLTQSGQDPGSFFSKLSEYTQKNIAKREDNMKRTEELRNVGKQMREEKLSEQQKIRQERLGGNSERKPFGGGGFR